MLEEINKPSSNFPSVFQKYFDVDNYLTWVAMNLLLNNYDTMSRNYLLYSPSYSDKWYFLPWDYDKCMLSEESFMSRGMKDFFGLARYWGTTLHKRFFSDPAHVEMLDDRIDELYAIMMDQDWQSLTQNYTNTILAGFRSSLDEVFDDTDADEIRENIADFQNRITFCYNFYYSTKDNPMPIFLGSPKQEEDQQITFNWSPSTDLQADRVYYVFSIFTDYRNRTASSIYREETSLTKITPAIQFPDGIYYCSAVAYDSKGNHQIAYDRYLVTDATGNAYYEFGMRAFQIQDGEMTIIK